MSRILLARNRRDHQGLGSCLSRLGLLGAIDEFHDTSVDTAMTRDDQDTPDISWPNYHSGANGDYQPVIAARPVHVLLRTELTRSGRIEGFPAHAHDGSVSANSPYATAIARAV